MLRIVAGLVLLYIFLPIFVIVLFSFNKPSGKFNYTWQGFTLDNWAQPVQVPGPDQGAEDEPQGRRDLDGDRGRAGHACSRLPLSGNGSGAARAVETFLVLPLTAPEVVMGASLLTLFLDLGWATGFATILIAHVAFEISFIAMTVQARVRGFDWTLEDASMDLGANPTRTFFKVTLPLIVPGIVAAAMLSFALSLDDFIITYFVSGSTVTYPAVRQRGGQGRGAAADRRARHRDPGDQPDPARRRDAVPPQARRPSVRYPAATHRRFAPVAAGYRQLA